MGIVERLEFLDVSNMNLYSFEVNAHALDSKHSKPISDFLLYFPSIHIRIMSQLGALRNSNSLKSLRISTCPHIEDFNVPRIISEMNNLRSLWIEAPVAPHTSTSSQGTTQIIAKTVIATDLRKEMAGPLPYKLRKLTVSGKGYKIISDVLLNVRVAFHRISHPHRMNIVF